MVDLPATDVMAMDPVPCIIDNKPVVNKDNLFQLTDPHTGELKYHVSSATVEDAKRAVDSAAKAFETWRDYSPSARRKIFQRAHQLLLERREEYTQLVFGETTSSHFWSAKEVDIAGDNIEETAALANSLTGFIAPSEHGQKAYVQRVPYGVVFGMAPWNAPLILSVRAYCNAIMAGNTVVLKTSEYSPRVHLFGAKLFYDAGLPEGVLNVLHMAPEQAPAVSEAVIAHPAVRKVNFTGSTFVGRKIGEVCGRYLKPVVLELGGKAPVIVLPDADLDVAANGVIFGGLTHSGQICMSSDILVVHETIVDKFAEILRKHLASRPASAQPKTFCGYRGVFNAKSANRITGMISEAVNKGAKVVAGTQKSDGNVIQPVIVQGTTPDMAIDSEEIFGPAMILKSFKTVEEALKIANASEYGLAASVYGKDEHQCFEIANKIEAGQVHINGPTVHDTATIPHGGLKNSGFGRFNGIEGLREFSTTRTITINVPHTNYPM